MVSDSSELLQILNAHGQRFLESFSVTSTGNGKRKSDQVQSATSTDEEGRTRDTDDDEEEWMGCNAGSLDEHSESPDIESEQGIDDGSFHPTKVMTLSAPQSIPSVSSNRAHMKAFMSSKVSKTRGDIQRDMKVDEGEESGEDERTNTENDALLHRLVHTQLLSGSLKPDLSMTSAQRRKALAGRVLELSGSAKIGKGEAVVRMAERNKAASRVRKGIAERQKERGRQQLEQAKDLGNYHPTIKKLFKTSETPTGRKRERGLKMGIGKFRGGILKLSQEEMIAVQNTGQSQGHGGAMNRKRKKARR